MHIANWARSQAGNALRLALCLLPCLAGASSLTVKILDEQGHPVSNAVVELLGVKPLPAAQSYRVDQRSRTFVPHVIVVPQGASIWFPNSDDIRHHVYSFSAARPFELKLYSGTPTEPVHFPNVGMVALGCNIHDSMTGFIYVSDAPRHQISDAQGEVTFSDVQANGPVFARIRHPWSLSDRPEKRPFTAAELEFGAIVNVEISTPGPDPRKRNTQPDNPFARNNPFAD